MTKLKNHHLLNSHEQPLLSHCARPQPLHHGDTRDEMATVPATAGEQRCLLAAALSVHRKADADGGENVDQDD